MLPAVVLDQPAHVVREREVRRRDHVHVHPEARGREQHGVAHAVAVTEPRHGLALEPAAVLEDRERVADRLDRVVPVAGFAVDDRDRRRVGQLAQDGDRLRARHDRVQEATEHAPRVGHAFAARQVHLARPQVDGVAAELRHPGLEADAGARRRVVEDHPEVPAGQERRHVQLAMELLEDDREMDELEQFLTRVHLVGHEVATAELGERRQLAALHLVRQCHRLRSFRRARRQHGVLIGQTINSRGVRDAPAHRAAASGPQACGFSLR